MLRGALVRFVVLALAAAASPAGAQLAPLPGIGAGTRVEITAERLVRDRGGEVRAVGNARLVAGDLSVAGEELIYDPGTRVLRTTRRTTVKDGLYVLRVGAARLDLDTREGTFEDVELYQKKTPIPFEQLVAAKDLQAPGVNALALTASRVERTADGELVAEDPQVTLCDCGDGEKPSWRFIASSATVVPGESVSMVFPRLTLPRLPAPPLPLPYLSLPLAKRKTGLLVPDLAYTARRGAQVQLPLYIVLGRSYDATVSPAYFTGPFGDREPAFEGPRLGLEFRYAPRIGTAGRAFVSTAYDLSKRDLTADEESKGEEPLTWRNAYQLRHEDEWSEHVSDLFDLNLVSDRRYVSDFTDEVRLQGTQVTRSVGWVNGREGTALLAASALYTQDLRRVQDPQLLPQSAQDYLEAHDSQRLFGSADTRATFQRFPVLQLDVVHLDAGPVAASLELEAARVGPVGKQYFDDSGRDGLSIGDTGWRGPDATENDGVLELLPDRRRGGSTLRGNGGELAAVTRLTFRPTVTAPFLLPPFVAVRPYAGWRENVYLYDAIGDGTSSWGVFGVEVTSEIARTFSGAELRHAIQPRLDIRRLVPGPGVTGPPRPYDELDLGPPFATTQAELALSSRLDPLHGSTSVEATVGEDLELAPELRAAEAFAEGSITAGPFSTSAGPRWEQKSGTYVDQAGLRSRLRSARGDELRVGYLFVVGEGGSRRLRAGPDEIFATEDRIRELGPVSQMTAGATVALGRQASVRYDILRLFTLTETLLDQPQEPVGALQQTAGFSYRSPCDCWAVGISGRYRRGQTGPPDIFFNLDLASL